MVSSSDVTTITTVIMASLANRAVRSNKLRKIVCNKECKELKLTWTDYQEIVDKLISDEKVVEKQLEDGAKELSLHESLVSSSSSSSSSSPPPPTSSTTPSNPATPASPAEKEKKRKPDVSSTSSSPPPSSSVIPPSYTAKRSELIPVKVALHLLKQEGKKKHNIEVNTKTRMLINGDFEGNATATLEIYAEEAKRLDAAMVFVTKFRQAYKKNPDHFEGDKGKKRSADGKKRQRKFY
ncbi:hypothetical protein TrCOL_g3471 [Triparma columacea]|uniref:Uncharacterized protein n=1 Tax=Triparma columacea TaxID=722753 RepID=A0A9W7GH84_9STRA|nr:hypothetical protein TrCOL_g3471 [Triparma columacea]